MLDCFDHVSPWRRGRETPNLQPLKNTYVGSFLGHLFNQGEDELKCHVIQELTFPEVNMEERLQQLKGDLSSHWILCCLKMFKQSNLDEKHCPKGWSRVFKPKNMNQHVPTCSDEPMLFKSSRAWLSLCLGELIPASKAVIPNMRLWVLSRLYWKSLVFLSDAKIDSGYSQAQTACALLASYHSCRSGKLYVSKWIACEWFPLQGQETFTASRRNRLNYNSWDFIHCCVCSWWQTDSKTDSLLSILAEMSSLGIKLSL